MSKSYNKVLLMGNVGRDPEVYNLPTGMVVRLTLATNEQVSDGRGGWKEHTEWHDLVAKGKAAQILRDYVKKGSRIFIEGKNQTNFWEDRETHQTRYRREVAVVDVNLLSFADAPGGRARHSEDENFAPYGNYAERPEITRDEVPY
jgi:single-strand DNA-binding protein